MIRAVRRFALRELLVLVDALTELHSDRGLWGRP